MTAAAQDETLTISGFEVLTKLSSGGMGDVILARRRGVHGFEKLLAIKTIRGELAKREDIRAMFLDEARLSARLDHPNIAQVYDFGEQNGSLYLAMEYVPGIALNKLLVKRAAPLPPVVAMRIIAETCRGLHAAHELTDIDGSPLGVVHRDVTPGNVILTFDGRIKILDFGIAFMRGRESPDTVVGELKGKPSYMAPEHLRGEGVDRRADLYSASVVLHELLTCRKLFTRETVFATVFAVEQDSVPPPSTFVPSLPAGLDDIVLRGLEKRPQNRFADARSMALALDRLIAELGGETLESFVESELSFEREQHRTWIHSVLSGKELVAGDDAGFAQTPSEKSRSGPAAMEAPPPQAQARPLVDHTTLVPPGADASDAVAVGIGRQSKRLTWFAVSAVAIASAVFGYRATVEQPAEAIVVPASAPHLVAETFSAPVPTTSSNAVARTESATQDPAPEAKDDSKSDPNANDGSADRARKNHAAQQRRRAAKEARDEKKAEQREAARVAQPEGFGFVTVGAQPYALVRIDGQEVGVTPIMRKKLPAGAHEIQLVRPDTGEVRFKRVVKLADGEHERITIP